MVAMHLIVQAAVNTNVLLSVGSQAIMTDTDRNTHNLEREQMSLESIGCSHSDNSPLESLIVLKINLSLYKRALT